MTAPIVTRVGAVDVIRDDLYPGGTKARFLAAVCRAHAEVVYASPAQGGAQTALAHAARAAGSKATIFVPRRAHPHPRALEAKAAGAVVMQVAPGYLTVVEARARAYCAAHGAYLIPFGADIPEAAEVISAAALAAPVGEPDEVWCAAGSGVLMRALARAWPGARRHAVQIGRTLTPEDVAGAEIHIWPRGFDTHGPAAPFPADPHYDAKAWAVCAARHGTGRVVFWNVTGPAMAH